MVKRVNMTSFSMLEMTGRLTLDEAAKLWKPIAANAVNGIADAIEANDFELAFKLASSITFDGILEKLTKYLHARCISAKFFGAQIQHDQTGTGAESATLPTDHADIIDNALAQFATSLQTAGADYIRTQTAMVVSLIEKARMITKSDVAPFPVATIRKAADDALAKMLNDAVLRGGAVRIHIGAHMTTSRLVSFGALAELQATGADGYRWTSVLEPNTCNVCRGLHGRKFEVAPALHRLETALRTVDPAELKSITPFAPTDKEGLGAFFGLTTGELQARGYGMPPIHPSCSCYVVPIDHPLAAAWEDAIMSYALSRTLGGMTDAA